MHEMPDIPAYERFLTVDELARRATVLAETHPTLVHLVEIGRSTNGEPIRMLRIGRGEEQLLYIGCPHPNEPIGMLTIDLLAERLAASERLRGERFTWNLVLCADPDGVRLNQEWFAGPFSLSDYARGFFRPAFHEQAILTFPFEYRGRAFLNPRDETRALMNAITALRPRFIASLHNAALGGGYFYVSPQTPALGEPLLALLQDAEIPLALGEPELPWGIEYAPAVFECTTIRAHIDYVDQLEASGDRASIETGETTYGFAKSLCDPLFMICEVPYFADSRIADMTPAARSRREAMLEGSRWVDSMLTFCETILARMHGDWSSENPYHRSVAAIIPGALRAERSLREWAGRSPETDVPATVAQAYSSCLETPFYHLLNVGTLRRALAFECHAPHRQGSRNVSECLADVEERFLGWLKVLEEQIDYRIVPIADLVRVQLESSLMAINTL